MINEIDKRITRFMGKVRNAFRGLGARVNSTPKIQLINGEGLNGEPINAAEYFQHYGLTSNPPAGFMFVAIPVGGKTAHSIIVATEHETFRLKSLALGEVAIYDDQGQKIHITRAGIVINGAGKPITVTNTSKVRMETALLEVTGEVKDKCDGTGKTMSSMRTTYNSHTHNDPQGGTVGVPNQAM